MISSDELYFMSCSVVTTRKRSYGKVMFSQVSVCSGGGKHQRHRGIGHMIGYPFPVCAPLPAPPPNPCFPSPDIRPRDLPPPSENIRPIYPLVEITGDLSKLAHLGTYSPQTSIAEQWPLNLQALTVSKWAVRILLQRCLVIYCKQLSL